MDWNWDDYYSLNRQGRGYQTPVGRYLSYELYPDTAKAFPTRLHATGCFYTGFQDEVKCNFCQFLYSNWDEGDVPEEIHRLHSPQCPFLTENGITAGSIGHIQVEDTQIVRLFTGETNGFSFEDVIDLHEHGERQIPGMSDGNTEKIEIEGRSSRESNIQTAGAETSNTFLYSVNRKLNDKSDASGDSGDVGANAMPFADYEARLRSYEQWSKGHIAEPSMLARAGFYFTGRLDIIRCYNCRIEIRNLIYGIDPWEEHARMYPDCDYLIQNKGELYVQRIQQNSHGMDAEHTIPKERRARFHRNMDEQNGIRRSQLASQSDSEGLHCNTVELELTEQTEERIGYEEEIHEQLNTKCKFCLRRESDMVFLPCRHLVCCRRCADGCSVCIICSRTIMRKRRIYR